MTFLHLVRARTGSTTTAENVSANTFSGGKRPDDCVQSLRLLTVKSDVRTAVKSSHWRNSTRTLVSVMVGDAIAEYVLDCVVLRIRTLGPAFSVNAVLLMRNVVCVVRVWRQFSALNPRRAWDADTPSPSMNSTFRGLR